MGDKCACTQQFSPHHTSRQTTLVPPFGCGQQKYGARMANPSANQSSALLWIDDVSKAFPGVQALEHVSLHVQAGEVLGLIGQNGAGKSTLMKILSGVYLPDVGAVYMDGQPVQIRNPHHAQELGISIIYQELNLMPNLSVMENIFIGREPGPPVFFDRGQLERQTQADPRQAARQPEAVGHRAPAAGGRPADGGDRQGPLAQGAGPHHGRAHLRPERDRNGDPLRRHPRAEEGRRRRHLHLPPPGGGPDDLRSRLGAARRQERRRPGRRVCDARGSHPHDGGPAAGPVLPPLRVAVRRGYGGRAAGRAGRRRRGAGCAQHLAPRQRPQPQRPGAERRQLRV